MSKLITVWTSLNIFHGSHTRNISFFWNGPKIEKMFYLSIFSVTFLRKKFDTCRGHPQIYLSTLRSNFPKNKEEDIHSVFQISFRKKKMYFKQNRKKNFDFAEIKGVIFQRGDRSCFKKICEKIIFRKGSPTLKKKIQGTSRPHQPAVSGWNSNLRCCLSRRAAPNFFFTIFGYQAAIPTCGVVRRFREIRRLVGGSTLYLKCWSACNNNCSRVF